MIHAGEKQVQCAGKERFANGGAARAVMTRMLRRQDLPLNAYHCQHCGGWHIGNKTPKNRK